MIVPDDDILKFSGISGFGITRSLGKILDWIQTEFDRMVEIHKDRLPNKAKKAAYPHFIWIEPPLNDNFNNNESRRKFNRALNTVTALHQNTSVLQLKKVWSEHDLQLYLQKEDRYTSSGLHSYWEAVDKAIKYADTLLMKKKQRNAKMSSATQAVPINHECGNCGRPNDRYHWIKSTRK